MRKVLAVVLGLLAYGANAQDFKPFKVNTSLGYAKPMGAGSSAGILLSVEPKYGLNDQIDVGLRMEGAFMARAAEIAGEMADSEISISSSYVLTGTYMLTNTYFRPYVGIGGGLYSVGSLSFSENSSDLGVGASRKLGAMARVGFKLGHFNMGVEYNLVPTTKYTVSMMNGTVAPAKSNNSYLGFKLGFDIGGGYYE
ncbi:outer membrane beta-barrel protein [Rudanella lutea]|uniref:outer membrane beta-barrel protein n=1 Tax=Rudanella lutea TaxID=451374 RepID=UPI000372058C|nr:outer membrane beta-barrel protein [Rudanella lutea]